MTDQPDTLHQLKLAIATVAGCIVRTLNESDQSFEPRFLDRLRSTYEEYRKNSDADPTHVLEVIHWTGEMLKGWHPVPGQDEPLLGDDADPSDPV